MSDEDSSTTTEVAVEVTEESPAIEQADDQESSEGEGSWDPEKAKRLIGNLREDKRKQQERAAAAEKKAASVDDLTRERDTLATHNLRLQVALDLGLPREIATRLQGKDRDEMVADAEQLLELLAPAKRPATRRPAEALRTAAAPDNEPEVTDPNKIAARMFRN